MIGQNLYLLALPFLGIAIVALLSRLAAHASFVEMNGEAFRGFFSVIFFTPHEARQRTSYSSH